MSWIDVLILGIFFSYSVYSGLRNKRTASKNLEEYFLAGRSLKGWQAGVSMAATQFAADTPLLITGLIATDGIFSLWRIWIYAVAFLMMGFLLAPSWRKSNVLTDAELTEMRYGSRAASILRGFKAVYLGTIFNCIVLAMVILAATRIFEPFLLWHNWLPLTIYEKVSFVVRYFSIQLTMSGSEDSLLWVRSTDNVISLILVITITSFYSTVGGLRSVVFTDIFQFFVAMISTAVFSFFVVKNVGGMDVLHERIVSLFGESNHLLGISSEQLLAFTPSVDKESSLALLTVIALQWLLQINSDGTGYLAQRSMACRSDQDAKIAAVVFTILQVFVRSLLWLPIGLGLLIIFPPTEGFRSGAFIAEREFTYVRGISELLPVGAKGLMLAGMLAAIASTLDTHLNWGASYWTNDIYKRFICQAWLKYKPTEKSLVWVARGANFLTLLVSILLLPILKSIQEAWKISLLLGAGMGILLVLRWVWWRINAAGELTCVLFSMAFAPLLLWLFPSNESYRLLLMALGATVIGVLVSLMTKPEEEALLKRFYELAQPPGFWGPISSQFEGGHFAVKRFWNGLKSTVLAAFSIFCLLTATGSYLVGSPPPSWFPWRSIWILSLFAIGISLFPVWIHMGFFKGIGPERADV